MTRKDDQPAEFTRAFNEMADKPHSHLIIDAEGWRRSTICWNKNCSEAKA